MTSLRTSCDNVFKGTSDLRKLLLNREQPELDKKHVYLSITDHSPVLCDTHTKKINETKKKKQKCTITKTCNHKRTKCIHYTQVKIQEDRDKYNKQQRKWRSECVANNPTVK